MATATACAVHVEGEFKSALSRAKLLSRKTKNQKHHVKKKREREKRTHSVNLNSIKLNNKAFYFRAKVNH